MSFEFEEDRQRFLQQFGVTAWYTRIRLNNAKNSGKFWFRNDSGPANITDSNSAPFSKTPVFATTQHPSPETDIPSPQAEDGFSKNEVVPVGVSLSEMAVKLTDQSTGSDDMNTRTTEVVRAEVAPAEAEPATGQEDVLSASAAAKNQVSKEIWARYSSVIGSRERDCRVAFFAQISPALYNAEHALFKNLLIATLKLSGTLKIDEFTWPPFAKANLPGQDNKTKDLLLLRWIQETNSDYQIVLGAQTLADLPSVSYLPSLYSMLSSGQAKHAVWVKLRALDYLCNP